MKKINSRTQSAIIESLKVGVVPKIGLQHIQVGRNIEIEEMIKDFKLIKDCGSKTRFIIGEYGCGKSFFLNLAKLIALDHNFVVLNADITTNKTFASTEGKSLALFSEMMSNASIKNRPDGNGLSTIIERWAKCLIESNTISEQDISRSLSPLEKYTHCYDFCKVLAHYINAYNENNDTLMSNAIRWVRGEYSTKTEARNDLGVRTIIDDYTYYEFIKLFSGFVQLAGFDGLIVCIDELAVLNRLRSQSRNKNFEQLLHIVNDSLQGASSSLGFIFSGTLEFLEDPYKGMYSYDALKTRLRENPFADKEHRDVTGIVMRLNNLSKEELYILCQNIRHVYAKGEPEHYLVSDADIEHFLRWAYQKLGANSFLKPRESIKSFIGLLTQLENYPDISIETYLGKISIQEDTEPNSELVDLKI